MRWLFPPLLDKPRRPSYWIKWGLTLGSFLIILTLVSCASRQESVKDIEREAPVNEVTKTKGLEFRLQVERGLYGRDDDIPVKLTIKNVSEDAITLEFPTSQRFDLEALAMEEGRIFRWSADRVFLQVLSSKKLEPGQQITEELVWEGKITRGMPERLPGSYTLIGTSTAKQLKDIEVKGDISIQ